MLACAIRGRARVFGRAHPWVATSFYLTVYLLGAGCGASVDTTRSGAHLDPSTPVLDAGGGGASESGVRGGTTVIPDDGTCEEFAVRAKPNTPDMLIVLDRSGSMQDEGRWYPSAAAVRSVTEKLDDRIRFGLMMFPAYVSLGSCQSAPDPIQCYLDAAQNGDSGNDCAPGTTAVPIGIDTGPAIASTLSTTVASGGTPTGQSLDAAFATLKPTPRAPDSEEPGKYVLLVTDGQPTCPNGGGQEVTAADIALSNAAIDRLYAAGAATYVVGYDTKRDPQLSSVLDEFARRGGTKQHRAVEDETSLVRELQGIAGELVSCSYQLEMEPSDPSYVLVTLDGKALGLNQPDGWNVQGTTLKLSGSACKTLRDGKEHLLAVEVQCQPVQVI